MTTQVNRVDGWPQALDYNVAIQAPAICFRDAELRDALVERHPVTRMPTLWTGGFADVYRLRRGGELLAVKCFKRSSGDVSERYASISEALSRTSLPYFVDFRMLRDEMLVNGSRYPVVKMRWASGTPLHEFVRERLDAPAALRLLATKLVDMVRALEEHGLAHGDLQHGNILVGESGLTLVDYDGMFVPAFEGTHAPEIGLPNYQHPRRSVAHYGPGIDRFPLLVLCAGLHALAAEPSLWDRFNPVDTESFLFTRDDFLFSNESALVGELRRRADRPAHDWLDALLAACSAEPHAIPFPDVPGAIGGDVDGLRPVWAFDADGTSPGAAPWWVAMQRPSAVATVSEARPAPPRFEPEPESRSSLRFDEVATGASFALGKFAAVAGGLASLVLIATGWLVPGGMLFFVAIVVSVMAAMRWHDLLRLYPPVQIVVGVALLALLAQIVPFHLMAVIVIVAGSFLADRFSKWKRSASSRYGKLCSRAAALADELQRITLARSLVETEILVLNRAEVNEKNSSLLALRQRPGGGAADFAALLPLDIDRSIGARYQVQRQAKSATLASLNRSMAVVVDEQRRVSAELDTLKPPTFLDFLAARGGSQP
jgi:hypothetical protein